MSDLNLRFVPWLRRGLVRAMTASATESSAAVTFSMTVGGQHVQQSLRLRGPGDVVGIDPAQVIRIDPPAGTPDFEPNYFPCIEFATPDLPWMFTPAAPDDDDHLLPWLTLVTVTAATAVIETRAGAPLPVLTVPLAELPPDLHEMWAWAHVQTTSIYKPADLTAALNSDPEAFISRIMSPRNLHPDTDYLACLVPTFRAGVLAGMGLAPDSAGQALAWAAGDSGEIDLPVYYSWPFRTGAAGDFETLVTRLQPRELDATVGRRDMAVHDIGIPLPRDVPPTMPFFGALVSPSAMKTTKPKPKREAPDDDSDYLMRHTLYQFLTSEADEPGTGAYDYRVDDPVVTPGIYGRDQLRGEPLPAPLKPDRKPGALLSEEPIWYGIVNTLPRTRGAAGLGVRVVRRHQEDFMARAWREVTALRAINQTLQQATYASLVAHRWQARVAQLEAGDALQLTRTAHARILPAAGQTIWGRLRAAAVPRGVVSLDFQRVVRTGGVVHHALRLSTSELPIQHRIRQIAVENPARLMALSAHRLPAGAQITGTILQEPGTGTGGYTRPVTDAISDLGDRIDSVLTGGIGADEQAEITDVILGAHQMAAGHTAYVDALVGRGYSPTAEMQATYSAATALIKVADQYAGQISQGSLPTKNQMAAIQQHTQTLYDTLIHWERADDGIIIDKPDKPGSDAGISLEPIATALQGALNPAQTISAYLQSRITLNGGGWGMRLIPTWFSAAPVFEDAIYRYICELSPEYMLPGIGEIPQNTVGLVEVNGEFVEAALIGINHEMSREMRWREYPADLSGTWFRRFWNAAHDDIGPIGGPDWPGKHTLGQNLTGALSDDSLVLLIKGEVLRRYPNLAVYAVKATATTMKDERGRDKRVRLVKEPEEQIYPVFSGRLDNGVRFFGFGGLTMPAALGTATPDNTSSDGGYFFALQEQPTEPRFGLNEYEPGTSYAPAAVKNWGQLSRGHFMTGDDPDSPAYLPVVGTFDGLKKPDTDEDGAPASTWGSHAGAMARIVLQRPVRMLVHASAMLP